VYDGVDALQAPRVDFAAFRTPVDFAEFGVRLTPDQTYEFLALGNEMFSQARTHKPGRAGDANSQRFRFTGFRFH
jgi:hypothetical protein